MPGESPSRQSRDDRRVLLSVTVEIEDGRVEHIDLRQGDVPEEVAARFCEEHGIPLPLVAPLTEHIVVNLKSIGKEDKDGPSRTPSPKPKQKEKPPPPPPPPKASPRQADETCSVASERFYTEKKAYNTVRKYQSLRKALRSQKFSPRLLQHTFTFSSKTKIANDELKPGKDRTRLKHREISDRMKAICLRLYTDYLRHRQKVDEEARHFDEQYQERIQRDRPVLSKRSRRLMESRVKEARQFHNYGELLYQEGVAKEQERKKLIEQKQQEDELNELKLISPKPEISKFAKQLKMPEGVWERLLHDKQNQEHLQELRNELWESRLMECTFKPRINYLQTFERRDVQTSTRFEQLFYDAEHRRRRQAEYMQWFPEGVTFQPQINRNSVGHVQAGGSVFDRLLQYAERVTEKRQKLYESSKSKLVDPITGQELFKPAIGRQPSQRNAQSLPIGEFLYQMTLALESKKQSLMERDQQEKIELARPHYVSPKSEQLLGHLQERRLKQIFDYLDADKDGYVDLETADTSLLIREVMEEIRIVKTMSGSKGSISYDTFADLMQEAQRKIGSNGLHAVFKYREKEPKFPFRFKMCRLSKSLADRRRKFKSREQWYELLLADRQLRLEKMEALRKAKHKQEMVECTFSPVIHAANSKRYHYARSRVNSFGVRGVDRDKQEMQGFIFQESQDAGSSGAKNLLNSFAGLAKQKEDPAKAKKREAYLSDVPES